MTSPASGLASAVGLTLALCGAAHAADSPVELDQKRVEAAVPSVKVRSIKPVPMQGGLFEVIDQRGNILYLDAGATIGFECDIFDVATRRNLTQESLARLNAVDFSTLPKELAIRRVKGDGQRRLAVFADPDCPFCTNLEQSLQNVDNVTIDTYLYPIESLHPGATLRAQQIWCSSDPDSAWRGWLLDRKEPAAITSECESPVARIAEVASRLGVSGTPSLVFGSGRVVHGNVPVEVLEGYLDEPSLALPSVPVAATAP